MNFFENNQKIIEAKLHKSIISLAQHLRINISDWDFDSLLYSAILSGLDKTHPSKAEKINQLTAHIDGLLEVADALNLKLNKKYYWYKNLNEIKQINTYGNY